MKRLIIATLAFILVSSGMPAYAFEWQNLNTRLADKTEDGSKITLMLKDAQNRSFKVTYQDEAMVTATMARKIIKYKNGFYSWEKIRFKELNFVVSANFLEIIVVPDEIIHNDINLAMAIPAGITMTYYPEKEILRYDFRIMKDNLSIRIAGDYLNEDEMLAKLTAAYDNPLLYLQRTDPEHLLKEIETIKDETRMLKIETEKLRQALIYFHNEDWLNRFKAIPPETIQVVVELKRNNPGMTKSQLWKELKREKIKITKQELELLLVFYFNEY